MPSCDLIGGNQLLKHSADLFAGHYFSSIGSLDPFQGSRYVLFNLVQVLFQGFIDQPGTTTVCSLSQPVQSFANLRWDSGCDAYSVSHSIYCKTTNAKVNGFGIARHHKSWMAGLPQPAKPVAKGRKAS